MGQHSSNREEGHEQLPECKPPNISKGQQCSCCDLRALKPTFLGNHRMEVIHNFISGEDEPLTTKVQKGSSQMLTLHGCSIQIKKSFK